jgi:ABC-type transporter Mla subunit MlaD
MLRRFLGITMVAIAISGIILSIAGLVIGRQMVDDIGSGLDNTLSLTSQTLDTVGDTLNITRQTVRDVNNSITTTHTTASNVARTINESRPLLDQISQVASHDAPDSIEAVQASLPNVVAVAGTIDQTLTTLNDFQFDRRILGIPLRFDLGIDYAPNEPFDVSVNRIGASLDGLPARLRTLEIYLNVTDGNLYRVSQNLFALARDLENIGQSIDQVEPLLDDYVRLTTETNDMIRQTRSNTGQQVQTAKLVITIIFLYMGLTQIAPLYLGLEMLVGSKKVNGDS